ncbi:hypothetical protein L9F63_010591, partial [Diploptera punctata]
IFLIYLNRFLECSKMNRSIRHFLYFTINHIFLTQTHPRLCRDLEHISSLKCVVAFRSTEHSNKAFFRKRRLI